jgi:excisionase family DNA binding protein
MIENQTTNSPEIFTVEEAANYLKVSPGTIRKLVNENKIGYLRIASCIRIFHDDLIKSLRKSSNLEKLDDSDTLFSFLMRDE